MLPRKCGRLWRVRKHRQEEDDDDNLGGELLGCSGMGEWNDPSVMKEGARMDPSELESKDWNWVVAVGGVFTRVSREVSSRIWLHSLLSGKQSWTFRIKLTSLIVVHELKEGGHLWVESKSTNSWPGVSCKQCSRPVFEWWFPRWKQGGLSECASLCSWKNLLFPQGIYGWVWHVGDYVLSAHESLCSLTPF